MSSLRAPCPLVAPFGPPGSLLSHALVPSLSPAPRRPPLFLGFWARLGADKRRAGGRRGDRVLK